ncbi:hypothetical protein J2Z69_000474 [Paenibacillus shirakamiensis]|uniref:Diguanylate cyclase n=1 Tax=Paenibacillus shirakamiensis TaxID=1265935 RepID=A0ABS4JCR0_9BACL|nr:hypothetical protein [Paenibacillus shirakamiensis]
MGAIDEGIVEQAEEVALLDAASQLDIRDRYTAEYAGQEFCLLCREPVNRPLKRRRIRRDIQWINLKRPC